METYSLLREIADSWALVALTVFFSATILWVFRPGSGKLQEEAANSIFRNETKPAVDAGREDTRARASSAKEA